MGTSAILEMQEYYRQRAPIYDQSMSYDQAEVIERQKPVIDSMGSWLAGRDVLEIACGPAFWTNWLARSAKSIVATDYNENTLVEARKKGIDAGRVSFRVANAYALPELGSRFNAAFAVDWFCHVPIAMRTHFLEGLHTRLMPDACIVFCDQLPRPEEGYTSASEDYFQTRTLPDGSAHQVIKNYPSETDVCAIFAPYSNEIEYRSFPEARRWMVRYFVRS